MSRIVVHFLIGVEYINREFQFSHIQGVRTGDSVHIHAYDFNETPNRLKLSLSTRISTDSDGIAKSLGLQAQTKVELEALIAALEQKLSDEYRLSVI